jgi:cell shape-determining protein MreC
MIEEKESIIRDLEKELENKDNTQEENEKLKEEINNLNPKYQN